MEQLEKKILIAGRKTLKDSANSAISWKGKYGTYEQWTDYAINMRAAIKHFLEITEPLIEDVEPVVKPEPPVG